MAGNKRKIDNFTLRLIGLDRVKIKRQLHANRMTFARLNDRKAVKKVEKALEYF